VPLGPTLIELFSFSAVLNRTDGHLLVTWETASEVDCVGFYLWSADTRDGDYVQINEARIPSEGGPEQGASYEYIDEDCPSGDCCYKLEDIDTNLVSTMHGPVCVEPKLPLPCGTTVTPRGVNHTAWLLLPLAVLLGLRRRNRTRRGAP